MKPGKMPDGSGKPEMIVPRVPMVPIRDFSDSR